MCKYKILDNFVRLHGNAAGKCTVTLEYMGYTITFNVETKLNTIGWTNGISPETDTLSISKPIGSTIKEKFIVKRYDTSYRIDYLDYYSIIAINGELSSSRSEERRVG